ncbi:MAG TPA: Clp protease N-terminal domain-containing protein, partial [Opitutales bacterium]|nr:Clp protease N-terminal domain-containing protein [Opitutales bacterium]
MAEPMNINFNRYTEKSREAVVEAQNLARQHKHAQVDTWHLLMALLRQEHGIVPSLVDKINQGTNAMMLAVERELQRIPT